MPDAGKRETTRVPVHFGATVQIGDTVIMVDRTSDISLKGLYVLADNLPTRGSECVVTLNLTEDGGSHIEVAGKIARINKDGFAVEFNEIDVDSYEHLKNLVMYNSTDADEVEKDFDSHLGLKRAK